MKTKIKLILAIITFYGSFCEAQQVYPSASRELAIHKKSISSTAYIFEGTIIKQQCYYSRNKEILTCSVVQIIRIYKGNPQIKIGSVRVITSQFGHIGNNYAKIPEDGGGVSLHKGSKYIIFGKQAYLNMLSDTMIATNNTITLTTMDCDNPIGFIGTDSAQWGYTKYSTLDSLYSFLRENGLTVQEEVQENK